MTKRKLLVVSGMIGVGLVLFDYIGTYAWCDYFMQDGHIGSCPFVLSDIETLFFPFIPLFILSVIAYFLREEVFQSWWKFARVATPLSIALILLAPSRSHDWMFPIEKGNVAFFTSLIFIIVSTIVIIRAYRSGK